MMPADSTDILQGMIDRREPISAGTYWIDPDVGLKIPGGYKANLEGVVLRALPTKSEAYRMINIAGVKDVKLTGLALRGEREDHLGKTGEWGHGFTIRNSEKVELIACVATECWGDGIYIVGSKDVELHGVYCSKNRRQGMSVIEVDGLKVTASEFSNTSGTRPSAGIDFEPNRPQGGVKQVIQNVHVHGCVFRNNAGAGVEVAGKKGVVRNLKVTGCRFEDNGEPIKADMGEPQPSWFARLLGLFGIYNFHPTTLKV